MFKLKAFQKRDLARAALHDGVIIAWEMGCGKSLAAIMWPLLKLGLHPDAGGKLIPSEPVLVVAPGNLHTQLADDWKGLFGPRFPGVIDLDCQDTFNRIAKGGKLAPGWYISSFTAIAQNKIRKIPEVPASNGLPDEQLAELMRFFMVKLPDAVNLRLAKKTVRMPGEEPSITFHRLSPETPMPARCEDASIHEKALFLCAEKRKDLIGGVGEEKVYDRIPWPVKCTFSPSLADLVRDAFGCVCIDEAVRIKSEDSIIGIGCRSLRPKYRLVLTGTPIKNRLPDIFFLAAWCCDALDEANARWPYCAHDEGEAQRFADEFLVLSRDLTKEAEGKVQKGAGRRNSRERKGVATAEVCNIHRLWKLLAPVVLRRRMEDIGEEIVPRIRRPIVVPLGTEQAAVVRYHLMAKYVDKNGMPAIMAQLQALRSCAATPCSPLLEDKGRLFEKGVQLPHRSSNPFTPRNMACLRVIHEILLKRQQVVVAGAFHEGNDQLSRMLAEAGVDHFLLDGRMNPEKRGRFAMEFKRGLPHSKPVLLAGNRACGEGYSWEKCSNLIQFSFDWSHDVATQMAKRVHRLTSKLPVSIYPIMAKGTVDAKLESLLGEKSDSSELVLDGKLIGEIVQEVNLAELLKLAHSVYSSEDTVDERECQAQWPDLCAKLNAAYKELIAGTIPVVIEQKKSEEIVIEALIAPVRRILTLADLPTFRPRQLQLC